MSLLLKQLTPKLPRHVHKEIPANMLKERDMQNQNDSSLACTTMSQNVARNIVYKTYVKQVHDTRTLGSQAMQHTVEVYAVTLAPDNAATFVIAHRFHFYALHTHRHQTI